MESDFLKGLTFEFTGLHGFSRRSGGMMGWANHAPHLEPSFNEPFGQILINGLPKDKSIKYLK